MHQAKPENRDPNRDQTDVMDAWHVPVMRDDVGDSGLHINLVASAEVRSGVARVAGLRDLPRFEADFHVRRHGADGLHVTGTISATVGQTCVVTLEPLSNAVEEAVDLLFEPPSPATTSGTEAAGPRNKIADESSDETEPLIGGRIDLGAIATEFLILGLDPYPRKPEAVFQAPQEVEPEERPFAALAGLRKAGDAS
jgi:hypothetical protein